jgi:hypothetical protein
VLPRLLGPLTTLGSGFLIKKLSQNQLGQIYLAGNKVRRVLDPPLLLNPCTVEPLSALAARRRTAHTLALLSLPVTFVNGRLRPVKGPTF